MSDTPTRATRTRQASGGEDRPCATAPADLGGDRGYLALKRPRQGQAATPSPTAILDPSTGPDPVTPAGFAGPGDGPPVAEQTNPLPAPMSVSSRGSSPPLELDDMPCGVVKLFRRPDGRLVFRRMPCRVKGCDYCGPRLRARWSREWAHAMAGDQLHRLVVSDRELARLRRRKSMAGHEVGVIPGPDGTRVVYTTAPVGSVCEDVPLALTSDFAAMPNDGRRRSLSDGWRQIVDDVDQEVAAAREPWECLGRVGRSLEQVAIIAAELGLLLGRGPDMLVLEAPDEQTEGRLFALVRLQRGWHRRAVAA
jgi:hypothetical protein